ncbi:MAG: hypothetical protein JNL74_16300 [Fibrobacteres bacterium]|nr:hypothetical protein [Fibrobacterota bacterium]
MEHARDIDLFCYGLDGITILKMAAEMETSAGISVDVIPADQETPFINLNLSKGRLLYDSARAA